MEIIIFVEKRWERESENGSVVQPCVEWKALKTKQKNRRLRSLSTRLVASLNDDNQPFFFSYKRSKTLLRFQRSAVKNDVWLKPNARELKWPTVKVESIDTFNMFNFCILDPLQMGIDVFLALSHVNDS